MHLSELVLKRLGRVEDLKLENLNPGLNVIYGDNGKGKTSIRNAVRFLFFGLPSRPRQGGVEDRENPSYYDADSPLRDIEGVVKNDNGELVRFQQQNNDGKTTGNPGSSHPNADEVLKEIRGSISKAEYSALFNITGDHLISIDPEASSENYINKLSASAFGIKTDPYTLRSLLNKSTKDHESTAQGKDVTLARTQRDYTSRLNEFKEDVDNAKRLEEEVSGILDLKVKLHEIDAEIAKLDHKKEGLAETRNRIVSSSEILDSDKEKLKNLRLEADALREQLSQINKQDLDALYSYKDEIDALALEKSGIDAKESEIAARNVEIEQITKLLDELGDLSRYKDIVNQERMLEKIVTKAERVIRAEKALAVSSLDLENARKTLKLLGDMSEETSESLGFPKWTPVPFAILGLLGIFASFISYSSESLGLLFFTSLAVALFGLGFMLFFLFYTRRSKIDFDLSAEIHEVKRHEALVEINERALENEQNEWSSFLRHETPELNLGTSAHDSRAIITKIKLAFEKQKALDKKLLEREHNQKAIDEHKARLSKVYEATKSLSCAPLHQNTSALSAALEQGREALSEYGQYQRHLQRLEQEIGNLKVKIENDTVLLAQLTDGDSKTAVEASKDLAEQIQLITENLSKLRGQKEEYLKELTRLKVLLENAAIDSNIEEQEMKLADFDEALFSDVRHYLVRRIASNLLENAIDEFNKSEGVDIERESSLVLNRITGGQYIKIDIRGEGDDQILSVSDNQGNVHNPAQLSAGTADQVYLAIRLALLSTMKSTSLLPVVFDDVLSSSDDTRRDYLIEEIIELSKKRQVIVLTHERGVFEAFKNSDVEAREIVLQ